MLEPKEDQKEVAVIPCVWGGAVLREPLLARGFGPSQA